MEDLALAVFADVFLSRRPAVASVGSIAASIATTTTPSVEARQCQSKLFLLQRACRKELCSESLHFGQFR